MNETNEPITDLPGEIAPLPALEADKQQEALPDATLQAIARSVEKEMQKLQAAHSQREEELQQRQDALQQRESALKAREMHTFAQDLLSRRQLPSALLPALDCRDEESCQKSLERVELAFRSAVQQGVMERMRGSAPHLSQSQPLDALDDHAYYHATYLKT